MESQAPPPASFDILVVEDEFLIAMELSELLEEGGYNVIGPVATVAAALAIRERDPPHACVLDGNLRGELSAPVAEALKQRKVPFLLSSAYSQETLAQHAAFAGAINIGKPAPPEKLFALLASLLKTSG